MPGWAHTGQKSRHTGPTVGVSRLIPSDAPMRKLNASGNTEERWLSSCEPGSPTSRALLDAIIVGGGPAGLSAALVLGRCLRHVLVCDAGHPRNEPARIFNGFLSRDGSTPAEFLQICRDQLRRYETIEFRKVKVVDVERGDCRFTAILETGERVTGRMFLLATGLVDELPRIENFRQFYGSTVHSCPYCDGWECRGQPIAVIGCNQESLDLAIELLLWSKDLVLCTNGPLKVERKAVETFKRLCIRIIDTPIALLEGAGDKLEGIRFTDSSFLPRSAVFFSPGQYQRSPLAEQLGCEFCEENNCIQCGEDTATNVPGLYAAGNASRGVQLVIAAAAEGMQSAFAINNALLEADAERGALKNSPECARPNLNT
jgi:thioredoxin reductase